MTTRQEKVSSLIQRLISEYLATERLEGITGLLTITAVDVSADLEYAKIYFSSLGQDPGEAAEILKQHIYEVQGVLYRSLAMKKIPRIVFVSDSSGEYVGRINKVLKDLRGDRD